MELKCPTHMETPTGSGSKIPIVFYSILKKCEYYDFESVTEA